TGEGPDRPPVKMGAPITDITAGILGALGIVAAYAHKLKTGEGQMVDTSLFEAGIVHTYWQSAIGLATGVAPGPMGSAHPLNAPYQAFQTADGWITLGAANQKNWLRLLDVLKAPELAENPRFKENAGRMAHLRELADLLSAIIIKHPTADWLERLEAAGVPAGPVLDVTEVHQDPHTLAREMVVEVDHSRLGTVKTLGLPVKFSETPGGVESAAPVFGQHTREVLAEHGYDEAEIDDLIAAGAVTAAD
ncbi:MAG: CaiB/BaiF CoA transferase family protein, partial [Rhodospirillales bacterium]